MNTKSLHFFLGGADAEMIAIKNLLDKKGISYSDAKLAWGASTSKYGDEIDKVAKEGKIPVIVELAIDSKIPDKDYVYNSQMSVLWQRETVELLRWCRSL